MGMELKLQENARYYKKMQEITRNRKKLQEITRNHKKSQEITRNHKKLQEITRNYQDGWLQADRLLIFVGLQDVLKPGITQKVLKRKLCSRTHKA
jgi:3-methyladenine DNA glycosylase Tag